MSKDRSEQLLESAAKYKSLLEDDNGGASRDYDGNEDALFSSSGEDYGNYDDSGEEYVDEEDYDEEDVPQLQGDGEDEDAEDDQLVKRLQSDLNLDEMNEDDENIDEELLEAFKDDLEVEDPDEETDIYSNAFRDTLKEAAGMKARRKTRKGGSGFVKRVQKQLDPEVRAKLSAANEAFVSNNISQAQKLYMEVITVDPRNYAALKTLGEIAKMKGKLASCCVYWILAAQVNSWDGEFWATVAELSASLGHIRQAIYCYNNAIKHDTKDHRYLQERTRLYAESGQLLKATNGYQKLLSYDPANQDIVIELAKLYSEQNRIGDAITMYLSILNKNIEFYAHENPERDPSAKDFPDFEWSELNILAELFHKQGSFSTGLTILKQTARWLQGRSDETFWDAVPDDDSEFDERRTENAEFQKLPPYMKQRPSMLPIDIRIKLGLFRLRLDNHKEAMSHFEYLLLETDIFEVNDLYLQVSNSLVEVGGFSEALKFLLPLSSVEELNTVELVSTIGKCFQETGDYEQAIDAYRTVLQITPENINVKLALAEALFYHGDNEESQGLLQQVKKSKSLLEQAASHGSHGEAIIPSSHEILGVDAEEEDEELLDEAHTALVAESKRSRPKRAKKKPQLAEGEKKDLELKLKSDTRSKFNRLQKLQPAVKRKDPTAIHMWLQIASGLVEVFCGLKVLFAREKTRQQQAELVHSKQALKMGIEQRLEKLAELHKLASTNYKIDASFTLTEEGFRGLTFDQWFEVFMQYSLLLALYDDPKDAVQTVEISKNIIVFQKDPQKDRLVKLVRLSIDLIIKDYEGMMVSLRDILNSNKFSRNVYRLFPLVLPSGRKACEIFISLNHQKYFLRQLKAWDSLRYKKQIAGQSKIDIPIDFDYSSSNPYLVTTYAQIMLSGKSYLPSLFYLVKAYEEFKYDPMICFLLGVASVHRGMQRSSGNRHMYILQALTYFDEYKQLRVQASRNKDGTPDAHLAQEVDFNFGRLFHHLNLGSIAIQYYEKVLQYEGLDEKYDMAKEAAYNLYLMYNVNGNSKLAKSIMDKYLTV